MTGLVNGKIALITGATGGIGGMTALQLVLQGTHVVIHMRSSTVKQPYRILAFALIFISLTGLSCQALMNSSAEPTSTAYPQPTKDPSFIQPLTAVPGDSNTSNAPRNTGELLFFDDFSNPNSGWDESTDETGTTGYVDEKYRISLSTANYYYWSNPGLTYGDVIVEVEAKLESGSSQNDIGIICRLLDNNNFYFLTISSDGYYQISKYSNGEEKFVGMDQYGYNSEAIKENDTNFIRAECVGDELALFANNVELARVKDADFQQGDVGLVAGTYEEPQMSVLFDNFKVYAP